MHPFLQQTNFKLRSFRLLCIIFLYYLACIYPQAYGENCPKGKYKNDTGLSNCIDCSKGKYNDQTGQSNCKDCSTGKYNNQTGQSNCKDCSTGKYNNQTDQSVAVIAPMVHTMTRKDKESVSHVKKANTTVSRVKDRAIQSSADCIAGKYNGQTNQSSCSDCAHGTYNDEKGQEICKPCQKGKYNNDTK